MHAMMLASAVALSLAIPLGCSGDEDAAPSDGGAGSGGTAGAPGTGSAAGGGGGCILIGCPQGYRSLGACQGCEPIPGYCSDGYAPCQDLRNGCAAGTFLQESAPRGCCACAPIDAAVDAEDAAGQDGGGEDAAQ